MKNMTEKEYTREEQLQIDKLQGLSVKDREQRLTNFLIAALEKGDIPWERGWEVLGKHKNGKTGREYSGNNMWILPMVAGFKGYDSNEWGTFNMWKELQEKHNATLPDDEKGWYGVKKGEVATGVPYWKVLEKDDPDRPGEKKKIFFKRYWDIFNRDQTGLPPVVLEMPDVPQDEREKKLLAALKRYADDPAKHQSKKTLTIERGGDQAFYQMALHKIQIPNDERFKSVEERVNVWAHEMFHSTGKHLNRKMGGGFGDEDYAAEELRAEMGAALICAEFGFDYTSRNNLVGYINSWLKRLKSDKTWLDKVSRSVGKGVSLILDELDEEEE